MVWSLPVLGLEALHELGAIFKQTRDGPQQVGGLTPDRGRCGCWKSKGKLHKRLKRSPQSCSEQSLPRLLSLHRRSGRASENTTLVLHTERPKTPALRRLLGDTTTPEQLLQLLSTPTTARCCPPAGSHPMDPAGSSQDGSRPWLLQMFPQICCCGASTSITTGCTPLPASPLPGSSLWGQGQGLQPMGHQCGCSTALGPLMGPNGSVITGRSQPSQGSDTGRLCPCQW